MFAERAPRTPADHIPTMTQKKRNLIYSSKKVEKKNNHTHTHTRTESNFKQVPLTFLRAHAVEVDHGRYDECAERAESA